MGLVASIRGEKSHEIIRKGLEVLINLTHRGAAGCDPETGDGAGILIQIPHAFFARECGELGMQSAGAGRLRRGHVLSACGKAQPPAVRGRLRAHRPGRGPAPFSAGATRRSTATPSAAKPAPRSPTSSSFLSAGPQGLDEDAFERLLYRVRRRTENEIAASDIEDKETFYVPSFSCRTIIYKGLMLAPQIEKFYFELANPLVTSALCLVHQRFSTNTFPSWKLAHPYRYVCHNGEINTIRGNVSWMNARQSVLREPALRRQDRQALSRSSCPRAATPLRSTTRSSSSTSPAVPCPT